MARVGVETKALSEVTDGRFRDLGQRVKGTIPDHMSEHADGLYLAELVWNQGQEHGGSVIPIKVVERILPGLTEQMITAELLEKLDDETVRIKGGEGRLEWLKKRRTAGKKGGKKGGRPPKYAKTPRGLQRKTPPAPAPAPALIPELGQRPAGQSTETLRPSGGRAVKPHVENSNPGAGNGTGIPPIETPPPGPVRHPDSVEPHPCPICGSPTRGLRCAICNGLIAAGHDPRAV